MQRTALCVAANGWALTSSIVLPAPRKRDANKPLDLTPARPSASKLAAVQTGAGQRPPVMPSRKKDKDFPINGKK